MGDRHPHSTFGQIPTHASLALKGALSEENKEEEEEEKAKKYRKK